MIGGEALSEFYNKNASKVYQEEYFQYNAYPGKYR